MHALSASFMKPPFRLVVICLSIFAFLSQASPGPTSVPAPPNRNNVRVAKATATRKNPKGDVPYGIPVPGKQGLVTSPFSPDSGYIDVRSFPPGTEVKDPYTGKSFLTP